MIALQNLWTFMLVETGGHTYYKLPVPPGTRMNIGVVTAICKAQGMSSVCLKDGCVFNSPGCRVTPLSTDCNIPLVGLAITSTKHRAGVAEVEY